MGLQSLAQCCWLGVAHLVRSELNVCAHASSVCTVHMHTCVLVQMHTACAMQVLEVSPEPTTWPLEVATHEHVCEQVVEFGLWLDFGRGMSSVALWSSASHHRWSAASAVSLALAALSTQEHYATVSSCLLAEMSTALSANRVL